MAGLLVVAIGGAIMAVADSEANLAVYSKQRDSPNGASGYPMLRLLVVVSRGIRTVISLHLPRRVLDQVHQRTALPGRAAGSCRPEPPPDTGTQDSSSPTAATTLAAASPVARKGTGTRSVHDFVPHRIMRCLCTVRGADYLLKDLTCDRFGGLNG